MNTYRLLPVFARYAANRHHSRPALAIWPLHGSRRPTGPVL